LTWAWRIGSSSLRARLPEGGWGQAELTFAGGGDLRVSVDCLDVILVDGSEPWSTLRKPVHAD